MGVRRKSRESAIKILYQSEIHGQGETAPMIDDFFHANPENSGDRAFTQTLVDGVLRNMEKIDHALGEALKNWELSRLGCLERAILRTGAFEILFYPDTPDKVAIDEAIELARTYCEKESTRLVNGALDKVVRNKNHVVQAENGPAISIASS